MLCTIDGETFYLFTKMTWIGNSGASCLMTNNDASLYDITKINELVQGSPGNMSFTKEESFGWKSAKLIAMNGYNGT